MSAKNFKSVRDIRSSLRLSSDQLGARVGKAGATVRYLEKAESAGSATLSSLSELAAAMDHELVISYAPKISIEQQLQIAAERKASGILRRVSISMALENQPLSESDKADILSQLVREMLSKPKLIHR